ncbi:hypothetical protein [Vulcanococcus sp.]|uniref:hypothetical protein n=1 Tax=Vulcanococcus sp. TaxID=2856995 RepID=UPI003C047A5B
MRTLLLAAALLLPAAALAEPAPDDYSTETVIYQPPSEPMTSRQRQPAAIRVGIQLPVINGKVFTGSPGTPDL